MSSGRLFVDATLPFVVASQLWACGGSPPPPQTTPPSTTPTIRGTERLGWDQRAADAAELATFTYAIYVDNARTVATGVSCATPAAAAGFACSTSLPHMANGVHTLTLAALSADGIESQQSSPLTVNVAGGASAGLAPSTPNGRLFASVDGAALTVDPIAHGLDLPTDLAILADGRLLVADRSGIRVVANGRVLDEPALVPPQGDAALAVAVAGDFARDRFVYVAGVADQHGLRPSFWLARFREAGDRLGERALLLDNVPASVHAAASLRVGPDANLYASFDDGGDARAAGDLASFNGKLLRLAPNGTTPRDQNRSTPVYVVGIHSPSGLAWDSMTGALWLTDADVVSKTARLLDIAETHGPMRAANIARAYALSPLTLPSAIAFYRGTAIPQLTDSLLVASDANRRILRVQLDSTDRTVVRSTSALLEDVIGGIRVLAVGQDGRVYVANGTTVFVVATAP